MSDSNEPKFLFFQAADGAVHVNVRLEGETVWLTQTAMAELFGCSSDNVSLHLKNIYDTDELKPETTAEEFSVVRQEGGRQVSRSIKHYNLDAIIASRTLAAKVGHMQQDIAAGADLQDRIFTLRGEKVILDSHLPETGLLSPRPLSPAALKSLSLSGSAEKAGRSISIPISI
jgi:hypothetical protein